MMLIYMRFHMKLNRDQESPGMHFDEVSLSMLKKNKTVNQHETKEEVSVLQLPVQSEGWWKLCV